MRWRQKEGEANGCLAAFDESDLEEREKQGVVVVHEGGRQCIHDVETEHDAAPEVDRRVLFELKLKRNDGVHELREHGELFIRTNTQRNDLREERVLTERCEMKLEEKEATSYTTRTHTITGEQESTPE